jgi:Ca2+-binding EF-hand superfamily protein
MVRFRRSKQLTDTARAPKDSPTAAAPPQQLKEVVASMVSLHVALPEHVTGHESFAEIAADACIELRCAALNAGWSRAEEVVRLNCDVVTADPPMADGPLLNTSEICGCAQLQLALSRCVRESTHMPARCCPNSNVVLILRGVVPFSQKAALAAAAGARGVIFVDHDSSSEMIAPQLGDGRDPAALSHVPAIFIAKADGDRLRALVQTYQTVRDQHLLQTLRDVAIGSVCTAEDPMHLQVHWWDLSTAWAARRIQNQWRRATTLKRSGWLVAEKTVLLRQGARVNSAKVGMLKVGDMIEVLEWRAVDGVMRVRCARGWASLRSSNGTTLLKQVVISELLDDIDLDGDGQISKIEAKQYMFKTGLRIGPLELDMMWSVLDTDCNGSVDVHELPALLDVTAQLQQGMKVGHALRLLKEKTTTQDKLVKTDDNDTITNLFEGMDLDGDGLISKTETIQYMSKNGISIEQQALDVLWSLVDADGNGSVDVYEIPALLEAISGLAHGMKPAQVLRSMKEKTATRGGLVNNDDGDAIATLFEEMDMDGDGQISKTEIIAHMAKKGIVVQGRDLDLLWSVVDKDGDGSVDVYELPMLMDILDHLKLGMKPVEALRLLRQKSSLLASQWEPTSDGNTDGVGLPSEPPCGWYITLFPVLLRQGADLSSPTSGKLRQGQRLEFFGRCCVDGAVRLQCSRGWASFISKNGTVLLEEVCPRRSELTQGGQRQPIRTEA